MRGILSLYGTFQLVENGIYSVGWALLDVLKLYVAAVPQFLVRRTASVFAANVV